MRSLSHTHFPIFLILLLVGGCVYSNHLTHPFHFDSVQFIPENPALNPPSQVLSWEHLIDQYFSRGTLFFTFGLNVALHGFETLGFHLVNLALHIINAMLVYCITFRLCGYFRNEETFPASRHHRSLSLFTALLFLCHPIQTESVVYIVSRSELLAGTFYLGGFLLFQAALDANTSSLKRYVFIPAGIFLLWVVGFSVKQTMVTLPALLALYYLLGCSPEAPALQFLKRWKYSLMGISGLLLGELLYYLLSDESFLIGPSTAGETIGRKNYMLSQPPVIVFYYLKLLLWPVNLNVDPAIPMVTSLASPRWLSALAVLAGLFYLARRNPLSRVYLFALAWFLIILSPSSSIITLLDLAAEHRVYLAAYGVILAGVLAFYQGQSFLNRRMFSGKAHLIVPLVLVAMVVGLGSMTLQRNTVWASELALWHDAEKKSPGKIRPLVNLGRAYTLAGDSDRSIEYYEKVLGAEGQFFQTHYNLAVLYLQRDREEDALKHFQQAALLAPDIPDTYAQLGEIYLKRRDFVRAERYLKKAVELNPKYAEAFRNLGALYYYELHDKRQGAAYLARSLSLNPHQQGADLIRELVAQETGP